ncbi:hypothetical protein L0B53_17035 [Vibrio sp. SS-MA-C1-2]|uniref:multiheme c-type cytochrome n=1 Tax=Vibrio sp. SS-MA-C1-2 TaxID=2908646 RepID=UPI001F24A250|nr:hypothetical protein [Vibrio sp. SS-MA-C1-2]UJF18689.1 hypothetical protein L0B53_17035 [Vibrio sp. SS-MA-C1-2]
MIKDLIFDWKKVTSSLLMVLALAGCNGGGSDSDSPSTNPQDDEPIVQPNDGLNLDLTEIKYTDNKPAVTVLAVDENGQTITGLTNLQVKPYQLHPQGEKGVGESAYWEQVYLSSSCEEQSDGYYQCSFGDYYDYSGNYQPSNIDRTLTQRFNVVGGHINTPEGDYIPRQEAVFDFDGNGNAPEYTLDVVKHETCTNCHNEDNPLTERHGSYFEAETCISCHNDVKLGTKRTEFNHLVHSIHNTTASFEDKNARLYDGEAAEHLIQNNCQSCHVDDDQLTESDNWKTVPTKEVCSGCHLDGYEDDKSIVYQEQFQHITDKENAVCSSCHTPESIYDNHMNKHDATKIATDSLKMHVTSEVVEGTTSENLAIRFEISLTDQYGSVNAQNIANQLNMIEIITNLDPNATVLSYYAKEKFVQKAVDTVGEGYVKDVVAVYGLDQKLTDDNFANGNITYTTSDLDLESNTAISIIGLRVCNDSDGYLTSCDMDSQLISIDGAEIYTAQSGITPEKRITGVTSEGCINCHNDTFQIHNSSIDTHHAGFIFNEDMDVTACAACHNSHGTYANNGQGAFERKLHLRHKNEFVVSECSQCHERIAEESFELKGPINTFFTGPVLDDAGEIVIDPETNEPEMEMKSGKYSTPIAATCTSCHDLTKQLDPALGGGSLEDHMNSAKAKINLDFAEVAEYMESESETCFSCHSPDVENHTLINN